MRCSSFARWSVRCSAQSPGILYNHVQTMMTKMWQTSSSRRRVCAFMRGLTESLKDFHSLGQDFNNNGLK